jgi:hypothetical protein
LTIKAKNRRLWLLATCLVTLVAAGAGFGVPARQQKPAGCPTTKVQCPDSVRKGGGPKFIAEVKGGDEQVTPTYNWTVSAGAIESGQGTSTIAVDLAGVQAGASVTATVEVGGYDRQCGYGSTVNSCTTSVEKQ